ncbi:MAG TPA: aminotransferase class V-fold PLP-dependent enzyme [Candidatus Saccharimonadales bacterium]
MNTPIRTFASDNYSAVHPRVIEFLATINTKGHAPSYEEDAITGQAKQALSNKFSGEPEILFVPTGTGANILSLKLLLEKPYEAVITSHVSHIFEEETGALATATGAHIFTVNHTDGKINLQALKDDVTLRKNLEFHSSVPKIVSIASTTEYGTYYTLDEVRRIASYCHENGLYLHMDGCRLPNAITALGCTLKEYTQDAGVDILSFGGAKNGLMCAEAIVIFNAPKSDLCRMQKQSLQLVSKMRYIAGQFIPYLQNDLWLQNARKANQLTAMLADGLRNTLEDRVTFTRPPVTNQVFCILPQGSTENLRAAGYQFYNWNTAGEVRFVTSWDNTKKDVQDILSRLNC